MNEEISQNLEVSRYTSDMLIQSTGTAAKMTGAVPPPGLLRSALVGREPAGTLRHLFSNLRELTRGEFIGEDPDRNAEASRLRVDRTDGHGSYELYRLDRDLFILTIDCLFDTVREEIAPGEGLLELHLCLRGRLTMQLPHRSQPVIAQGPCLLLLYQPVGADMSERLEAGMRYTGLSLYCRPSFLAELLHRNGIPESPLLQSIEANDGSRVWHETRPLSAGLHYVATSLLQSPYQQGFRLLHSEAKALELLCQVLSPTQSAFDADRSSATTTVVRQIDTVRRILGTQYAPIPHICQLARRVGMSESKLKRSFKEHFGMTVFEYGLECRMHHALELLRADSMSICQVAECVGYQHQTSFTAAFRDHFGFLPSEARVRSGARS
jgi:AraC-like DNA-binding protein